MKDLQWFCTFIHFFMGGLVSSPVMLPSQTAVWDLLCFPLVASPVPPRYTFPDSSFDSCLAQTSNVVHASLAMLLLKNLCLRHNQMAAARSLVGPNHGSLVRHAAQGSKTFSSCVNLSSVVIFGGGVLHQTQVMLWDIDLCHWPGCHFQDHVICLGVTYLGQR